MANGKHKQWTMNRRMTHGPWAASTVPWPATHQSEMWCCGSTWHHLNVLHFYHRPPINAIPGSLVPPGSTVWNLSSYHLSMLISGSTGGHHPPPLNTTPDSIMFHLYHLSPNNEINHWLYYRLYHVQSISATIGFTMCQLINWLYNLPSTNLWVLPCTTYHGHPWFYMHHVPLSSMALLSATCYCNAIIGSTMGHQTNFIDNMIIN